MLSGRDKRKQGKSSKTLSQVFSCPEERDVSWTRGSAVEVPGVSFE